MSDAMQNALDTLSARIDVPGTPSDWFEVTQERINDFADVTLDHQWIHIDEKRAKAGPFGTTIAHGHLTLSMMGHLPAPSPRAPLDSTARSCRSTTASTASASLRRFLLAPGFGPRAR